MTIPNTGGGGLVHSSNKVRTPYNEDGTSRAAFAKEAAEIGNRPGWRSEGLTIQVDERTKEPARQCAAADGYYCEDCGAVFTHQGRNSDAIIECPECRSLNIEMKRCQEIAIANYMTCSKHGGGFTQSPEHRAAALRGAITSGTGFKEVLYCPCNMFKESCNDKFKYYDEQGIARCWLEQQTYDGIMQYFQEKYDLDDAADMLILNRMAMTIIRIQRGEKLVAQGGEVVERQRSAPDGSVETWFEPNSAGSVVDKLDKSLLNWMKGLHVTRAARQSQMNGGINDIAALLSSTSVDPNSVIELGGNDYAIE